MSAGRTEQFDKSKFSPNATHGNRKTIKRIKAKRERRRAKENKECNPEYRKYNGFEL